MTSSIYNALIGKDRGKSVYPAFLIRLQRAYPRFGPSLLLISFVFILTSVLSAAVPYQLKKVVDAVDLGEYSFIYAIIGYAACWTFAQVLNTVKGIFSAWFQSRCESKLYKMLLQRIYNYPYSTQRALDPGIVFSDIQRTGESFGNMTNALFWITIPVLVELVVALLLVQHAAGALFSSVLLLTIISLLVISLLIAEYSKTLHASLFGAQNSLASYTLERLSMLYDVRLNDAFVHEDKAADEHPPYVRIVVVRIGIVTGAITRG